MLDKEFKYYIEHQNDLVNQYNGKHIVIIGDKVVGAYDSHELAYINAIKEFQLGTFLIQRCSPGPESYTTYIHSRRVVVV